MGHRIIFALIPLILSIGLISVLPFSDASEYSQICIEKVWLENSKGKIVCVSLATADTLVERGWGTILEVHEDAPEESVMDMRYMPGDEIDFAAELTLVPQVDGGDRALTVTPVIGTPDREFSEKYVVGTEELREDEMRITFCGTGMPFPVYQQASACVIVELGNGDVFLFDLGADSIGRVNGMQIDVDKLNKVFLGHLHLDHAGDLGILWAQGGFAGRSVPLEVYGPSGPNHELGTEVFVEHTLAAGQWDLESRKVGIPTQGMSINTHEFDFSKTQVIYEENGVTITSFPAIHILDGAVSFRLDWNDLSFVFSSDTEPNKFLVENSQNVDVLIHEGFIPGQTMSDITGMPLEIAIWVSEEIHTPPDAAGVVYDMTNPRLAVLYHVILTQEVITESFELLRTTYDGPSLYGEDLVTINVTPDYIISRPTEIVKNAYPEYKSVDGEITGSEFVISEWLEDARIDWKSIKEEKLKETQ
ncbi:MAG: MBL fold metallo-hydrolase [Nitrosopumilus sp.]|nr:MBL fold metallo-hydrolase [Nitrosopumilus sp.]MDH3736075.1 MBL fold metallo-hydrolase [Nitrosopumilus sp.]MDH3822733.1 MBL fold metallo-hydrolase [Nitrosopumilus sp.]MDH3833204.1 MBL fold metallo-hydrolase [Nitrosopumilus sp.]